ncbi:MAG: response regulator [Thermodesulfobacteriota bacterium]
MGTSRRYNFLVVEDNAAMAQMLANMLGNLGYNDVAVARHGKEAWEKIQFSHPPIDIILSDLLMPKMDGLQLLHRIRSSEAYWHLPFIMITVVDDLDRIMSVTEEHIDGYLVKPVTPEALRQKIEAALKKVYEPDPYHRALYAGKRQLREHRYDEALRLLAEARKLQPGQAATYYYLGETLEKQGKFDEAAANYQRCKDCSNDLYVRSLDGLARIHIRQHDHAAAVAALQKGIELSPNKAERYVDLSLEQNRMGKGEAAKTTLLAALKLSRKEHRLPQKFIEACLNCGLDAEAEEIMHKNLGAETEEIVILNHMGIVCRRRKEYERARGYYERALRITPNNDLVNYNYALLLAEMKEYAGARKALERILKQNPEFKKAWELMGKLDSLGV